MKGSKGVESAVICRNRWCCEPNFPIGPALDARALLSALECAAVIASPQTLLSPQAQFTLYFGNKTISLS